MKTAQDYKDLRGKKEELEHDKYAYKGELAIKIMKIGSKVKWVDMWNVIVALEETVNEIHTYGSSFQDRQKKISAEVRERNKEK